MIALLWVAIFILFVLQGRANFRHHDLRQDFDLDRDTRSAFIKNSPLAQSISSLRANFGILLVHLGLKWSSKPGHPFMLESISTKGQTDGKGEAKAKKVKAKK